MRTSPAMTDALTALRLQAEWGADEALADAPVDRFSAATPETARPPGPTLLHPAIPTPAVREPPRSATLAELYRELAALEGCALRTTATHTVQPDGNPEADLVVIADAPGSDDDRSGRAFSGP